MLKDILSPADVATWHSIVDNSSRLVLTAHSSPDGDAVGSALGLREWLKSLGKQVDIVLPNSFPDFLRWLPDTQTIIFYNNHPDKAKQVIDSCDAIVCLDFNDLSRINELGDEIGQRGVPIIMIDHHLEPKPFSQLQISHPEMCSTCEVVFQLLWQLGGYAQLSRNGAIDIYCGMMTDTGGFTYNSNRSDIYFIISQLLDKNIDKDRIYRRVFNNYSRDRIKLMGYVLYRKLYFYPGLRASVFSLSKEEMERFHFIRGDAEGFVNLPLTVRKMKLSISLREDTERPVVRVSLRSVDDFPCNKMAEEFFNGGGHLNASGGELRGTLEEARRIADKAVQAYADKLK